MGGRRNEKCLIETELGIRSDHIKPVFIFTDCHHHYCLIISIHSQLLRSKYRVSQTPFFIFFPLGRMGR